MLIAWKYDLKAGPLAIENYYLFSYMMYKPYSRVAQVCLGVQCGILYHSILLYRQLDEEDRRVQYPKIDYLHRSHFIGYLLNLGGIGLIITCLFCGYEALKDPYSWNLG